MSAAAAQLKGIDSPVAGDADILLVPNIETGNALFKMMVYFMSACAAGVVLGGRLPPTAEGEERRLPSVWIDMDTYEVVRIDGPDGVRYRFGPPGAFDGILAPSWISIEVPGQPPARLDVVRVARANAPAAAFGRDWLLSPPQPAAQ